jgi:hypothetical protein
MAFNFNEAREIVEAAKKRGLIRAEGEAAPPPKPEPKKKKEAAGGNVLPDWLQEGMARPPSTE